LSAAGPAEAQIYSWRDSSGTLVLSDRPLGSVARAVVTPPARIVRVAPPLYGTATSAYDGIIKEHSSLNRVRPDLVRAVIQVESGFNPRAVSPKGAMGLMQLMPATASLFRVLDAFDPAENIRAGVRYLRQLIDKYDGNEELALAAYNAGPAAVDKYGSRIPPYRETQDYVRKIQSATIVNRTPATARFYKSVEIVDGQPIVSYSDRKPADGTYEEISVRK
jgi:soluble lytic murein transglycosylase-like protein